MLVAVFLFSIEHGSLSMTIDHAMAAMQSFPICVSILKCIFGKKSKSKKCVFEKIETSVNGINRFQAGGSKDKRFNKKISVF